MSPSRRSLDELEWVGAHPALDFVNTVHCWDEGQPGEEYLHDHDDLLDWHCRAGLIDPGDADRLRAPSTQAADVALGAARTLRRHLHDLFRAAALRRSLPPGAVAALDGVIADTARWRRLVADGVRLRRHWDFHGAPATAVLGPVARAGAELLERGPLERIKQCPPPEGCGWLFLDNSRNRSRTWCSMKTCGNTAKVRRFRARQKDRGRN